MKNILVTGSAGFIGSNFVRLLLAHEPDWLIVGLDKLTYAGNLDNLCGLMEHPCHKFVKADICDSSAVEKIIDEYKIDTIVNFAAESHVDRSIAGAKIFVETNVSGTLSLLQTGRDKNVARFLQVSTDEVYGSLGNDGLFSENSPLSPNSPYSASKAAADHFVCAFTHTWDMDCRITRCSNNYGPCQFPEKMIPLMINNAINDKALPVYGDGLHIRDWIYVEDHCRAIWKVLTAGQKGQVYNIGGCNEKTNLEVIKLILKTLGKPETLIAHVKDRLGHDRRYAIDASKIMSQLGWKPTVTFEQGIEKTINWYLENKKWLTNVVSGEYRKYYDSMYSNR